MEAAGEGNVDAFCKLLKSGSNIEANLEVVDDVSGIRSD